MINAQTPPTPIQLRTFMSEAFSKEELAALCFDLTATLQTREIQTRIDLSIVGGATLPSMILNLIQYVTRRGWYDDLVRQVRIARPNAI